MRRCNIYTLWPRIENLRPFGDHCIVLHLNTFQKSVYTQCSIEWKKLKKRRRSWYQMTLDVCIHYKWLWMVGCVVYSSTHLVKSTQIDMIFMTCSLGIEASVEWSLNLLHVIWIFFSYISILFEWNSSWDWSHAYA